MKVADYLISSLGEQGVGHIFLDLGGLNDAFMPALTGTSGVRPIVAAFEGGAAYMADGYARAGGGLGVCMGIGGPGVLNMVTPLTAAMTDRTPVLAISGEVARSWEGMGGFQDASGAGIDDISALRAVTGLSVSLSSPAVVPHHLRHAMTHALTQRVPTHISVPVDVQRADIDATWHRIGRDLVSPAIVDERALANLAAALAEPDHQRIVVLAGPGVLHADGTAQLRAFVERFDIPVATTLSGKGLIEEDHPLALGVFGYGGSRWAIDAIRSDDVDVLIVVGSGLSQRDTLQWDPAMLPSKRMAHIDPDPLRIGRTWPSEHAVVANPATALAWLLEFVDAQALDSGRAARRAFLDTVRGRGPRHLRAEDTTSDAVPMHPARAVSELRAAFPDDGVLCVDSGAHRAWFAEYWDVRQPGTHYSLTNLGPMGGAIPLGIGVQLARPQQPLLVATGDGCMLMHGMELHTAAREGIPIVVAVMNNSSYGNIYYRAHAMGPGPERLTDIAGMDWVGFARSVGADGERVEEPTEIAAAVSRALATDGPYLLDLVIDKTHPTPVGPWRQRQREWEDND
ncbi:thiamine pyrophosphate-binding protein [Mycobacterium spongiae]|uniref:acetolactate synthase n=1 Tax=Mycobacterium spongiae TaxID=886343 RepID=A0A975PVG4_9MYCO|nr:thiamine pyrophosphate-binding protein [Mycobacterium spongiae]QUR66085.1 thiamine pyrophosphate-binding protein [Mycobacterium spongiae]